MNRMLIAGAAFTAVLGVAGVALAQPNPYNYEHGGKPTAGQQMAPSPFSSPGIDSPQWGYDTLPPAPAYPYPYPPPPPMYGR
jgi:hypothetical protein